SGRGAARPGPGFSETGPPQGSFAPRAALRAHRAAVEVPGVTRGLRVRSSSDKRALTTDFDTHGRRAASASAPASAILTKEAAASRFSIVRHFRIQNVAAACGQRRARLTAGQLGNGCTNRSPLRKINDALSPARPVRSPIAL